MIAFCSSSLFFPVVAYVVTSNASKYPLLDRSTTDPSLSVMRPWGQWEKRMSWLCITYLAMSIEETSSHGSSPNCRCINGPCFFARALNIWRGRGFCWRGGGGYDQREFHRTSNTKETVREKPSPLRVTTHLPVTTTAAIASVMQVREDKIYEDKNVFTP